MKLILGLLMFISGLVLGVYVGFWLMFVGGLVQIIHSIQAGIPDATAIAYGIIRIFFAGVAGFLSALILIIPGFGILGKL